MRIFWELAQRSFHRQITYRTATIAGLITNFFFGILRASVLIALYGQRLVVQDIDIQGAVTYTGISQSIIGLLSLFSWGELMNTIYNGSVANDLLKPMNYYRYWLAQDLGRAVSQLLLRTIPILLGYALLFDITIPRSWSQWLGLSLSVVFAWMLSFSYRFLLNLSGFWIPNATGIMRFSFILMWLFSGFLMPLRFYPDWFVNLCSYTPFPYMVNTVVEVYLGLVQGRDLPLALLTQIGWIIVLIVAGHLTLKAGVRRLVILGG